jgi:hypothetical protein
VGLSASNEPRPEVWLFVRIATVCIAFASALAWTGLRAAAQSTRANEIDPSSYTVLVLRPPEQDPLRTDAFNRLWAELRIHGFDVQAIDRDAGDNPFATLTEIATEHSAFAAFGFVRRDTGLSLDVVLVEQATGQTSRRRLAFSAGSSDASSLIAVRAVDLLRSSLIEFPEPEPELEPPPAPPPEQVEEPPPAAPPPDVAPREHTFRLAAEGTLLWPGSQLSVGFGPALAVLHRPWSWFEWGAWIGGVFGTSFDGERGTATVQQELGFLEARAAFIRIQGFSLAVAAGAGVFLLQAHGTVRQPLVPEEDSVASALFTLGLHADQSLGGDFALGLSARALALAPALGVAIAGERAKMQLPAFQASLGLSVGF